MVYLSTDWAEEFMKRDPGVQVAVVGGGSGTGIKALIDGTTDIANASRRMKPEELDEARSKGIEVKEFIVALDGLAIVVNRDNPVAQVNLSQLKDIFTGKIINWREVGGRDEAIRIISREANSGTHVYFREQVLKDENFKADAVLVPTSKGIAEETAKQSGAVGYVGVGDAKANSNVKILNIAKETGTTALPPSEENVKSGSYPISRSLYVYTTGKPEGKVGDFVAFMLGPEGQRIVEEQGYIPIQ
jgi:phosphate transport system substrate-binding protein